MRLDVFVSIALAQLDGSAPPTPDRLGWAIDGIKAPVDDELLGDDLRTLLAALPSHHAAGDADVRSVTGDQSTRRHHHRLRPTNGRRANGNGCQRYRQSTVK